MPGTVSEDDRRDWRECKGSDDEFGTHSLDQEDLLGLPVKVNPPPGPKAHSYPSGTTPKCTHFSVLMRFPLSDPLEGWQENLF
jgi:hypothetical protein